MTVERNLL